MLGMQVNSWSYHKILKLKDCYYCLVAKLCLTLWPMDYSPPGSSIHGILKARILEWLAISLSQGSFWPRGWTHISCIGRQILYHRATWEAKMKRYNFQVNREKWIKERRKSSIKKKAVKEKGKKENTVEQIESRNEPIYNSFHSDWVLFYFIYFY